MSDVQALITRHQKLLRQHALLRHLNGAGSLAQAQRLASHLSLLLLWLGDLARFAHERATEPLVTTRLAERSVAEHERGQRFVAAFEAMGLSASAPQLFSKEHAALREAAFARVADVTSAGDDRARLAVALAVSAICEELLGVAVEFAARAVNGTAPEQAGDRFEPDTQPQLSAIQLTEEVAGDVFAAVERCFESMLKVAHAIDSAVFGDALHVG